MKLEKIMLQNFKGCKEFTLEAGGENVSIYGANATGKSTIFDAFLWLLSGKDSLDQANFEIKTLGPNGEPLHGLEHSVEAAFLIDDHETITLKKTLSEVWKKPRGAANRVFSGHSTQYFVDGVPVQKKEFDARVSSIAPEQIFRLLTNPRHFSEVMHWQERRKILLEVCGDISDSDVIASDGALSKLPEILGNRTLEDHRKVISTRKTKINEELEKIPVRISEVEGGKGEIPAENKDEIQASKEALRGRINSLQQQLVTLLNGGASATKRRRLAEIEAELLEIANKAALETRDKIEGKESELAKLKNLQAANKDSIRQAEGETERSQDSARHIERQINDLRAQWIDVDKQAASIDTTCPTCGRSLPQDKIEEARAKFNADKAERLAGISTEGKRLKTLMDAIAESCSERSKDIERLMSLNSEIDGKVSKTVADIESLRKSTAEAISGESAPLLEEKARIESELSELAIGSHDEQAEIEAGMGRAEVEQDRLNGVLARIDHNQKAERRIEELKAQERELATELEKLESELYLTESFMRTKVNLLEERINSRFKVARFKLFVQQINGGLQECCEVMVDGVPYGSVNSAGRIQVGLDIISTLQGHHGVYPPVWIDGRESVTEIPSMDCQIISLIVSPKDASLRVKVGK
mgnify:CR=1 FL=1